MCGSVFLLNDLQSSKCEAGAMLHHEHGTVELCFEPPNGALGFGVSEGTRFSRAP